MAKDAKTISYNVEITEKGFVQVSSEVTKLNKAFSSVGESSKNMSLAIKTVVKDVRANTEAHGRTVNVMNAEISGLEQLRDSYGKSNKLYRQVQSRINAVIAEKKALTDVSSKEVKQEKTLLQQISALNDGRKRTVDVIQQEISLRRQMQSSTSTNRKEFLKEEIEIKKLERSLNNIAKSQSRVIKSSVKMGTATKSLNKNLGNTSSATGTASGAVVELGRTISDSNYGFPAMANNVQQLATQMTFVVAEQGGVVKGFKSIGKAMTGAGGVLLLFTIAVAIFEKFALKAREAKSEVKDLNEELAKRKGALDNIKNLADIVETSTDNIGLQQLALKDLKEKGYDPLIGTLEDFIKLKEQEMIFEIAMEEFSKSKLESLKKEEEIKTKIKGVEARLSGDIEPETQISGTAGRQVVLKSASKIRSELEAELSNLETSLATNGVNIATVNERIRQSYTDLANGVKDNPFTKSLNKGGEEIIKGSIADFEQQISVLEQRQQQATETTVFGQIQTEIDALLDKIDQIKGIREEVKPLEDLIGEETLSILEEKIPNLDLYVEALNNTYGVEIESTIAHHRNMKHLRRKDVKDEKISQQAKLNAIMTYADTVSGVGGMMQDVSEKNEKLAIAGVIIEKSAAIAGIIANTKLSNAAVKARYAGSALLSRPERTANTVSAGLAVAATAFSASKAISDIRSKNEGASVGASAFSNSEPATPPDFNIVGQSETNQLAQTIASSEEQPLRAYVVAEDVTTAQQLDNSIIQGASLG